MSLQPVERTTALKFDDSAQKTAHRAYESGGIGATVRYDDEKGIRTGDHLDLKTTDDYLFGEATVTSAICLPVWQTYPTITRRKALHAANSTGQMVTLLNHYYDDGIWPTTAVKLIFYDPEGL